MYQTIPRHFHRVVFFIILVSILVLLARATDLMLIKGRYFRELATHNRIREIPVEASRGRILDRNGRVLAQNTPKYFRGEELIAREKALELKAKGEDIETRLVREYSYKDALAPITGYLAQITKEELEKLKCEGSNGKYFGNDLIGRGGIEANYDCWLRGEPGEKIIEVNAQEKFIREIGRIEPKTGKDIRLTIDAWFSQKIHDEISKFASGELKDKKVAVVALDPGDGSVLAMVSSPSFDPNVFTIGRNEREINRLLNDSQNLPFLNRAISGAYHPGSIFKIVTASAGLSEGKINAETTFEDTGVIRIGEWSFANWYWIDYGKTEGMVNLEKAIKRSNDIFFYKVGEWVGADNLAKWARNFGLGSPSGIDLPNEVSGLVPDPQWKKEAKGESWFLGNTYHFAIGQGDLTMTPLQAAVMTAVVANGGKLCRPHLINKFVSNEIGDSSKDAPGVGSDSPASRQGGPGALGGCKDLGIKTEYINLIKQGMIEACSSGGTSFPFFDFRPASWPADWRVACKTGTAEASDISKEAHAWFTVFAPAFAEASAGKPAIVLTVLVERGGSGAYVAAPIAKKILEIWFNR